MLPHANFCYCFCFYQGGIAFVAIKGVLKIYYKQQQYLRQANRIIRDFEEDPQAAAGSSIESQPPQPVQPGPTLQEWTVAYFVQNELFF